MGKSKMSKAGRLLCMVLSMVLLAGCSSSNPEAGAGKKEQKEEQGQTEETSGEQADKSRSDDAGAPEVQEPTEEEKREAQIEELLGNMSLEDKVSQLFFVNPEALTGVGGAVQASDATRSAMESYPVGGVILFSANIENEEQLRTMTSNLHAYSKYPLFLGIDEEGGRVARIAGSGSIDVPVFPDMQEIGNTQDPEEAYRVGETIGRYVKELGFNVDFAPVADVASNPDNQVIGSRSFGSDAGLVSQMVAREVQGMQEQGVSASLKHFPGHGDTSEDSHAEMAVSKKTADELRNMEFLPFKAGIEAGVDMVMIGHISVPAITGSDIPASLSEQIITGCLREELGYQGIVVTDSMSMGAIVNTYTSADAAVRALQAGCDMLLMPQDFQAARQAVLDAVKDSVLSEERLDESLRRIFRVKLRQQ